MFFYSSDGFQKPNPFRADVAVAIDEVMEPTLDALLLMVSQIHEGGADGNASLYPPNDPAARKKRDEQVRTSLARRYEQQANQFRETLIKFYGAEKAKTIKYAQGFEICEYGRTPPDGRAAEAVSVLGFSAIAFHASSSCPRLMRLPERTSGSRRSFGSPSIRPSNSPSVILKYFSPAST